MNRAIFKFGCKGSIIISFRQSQLMMILIFASPHPALETDGTEDNWRAELAAKKAVRVPKKELPCRKNGFILFLSVSWGGTSTNKQKQ
jgi:hypothetical protein